MIWIIVCVCHAEKLKETPNDLEKEKEQVEPYFALSHRQIAGIQEACLNQIHYHKDEADDSKTEQGESQMPYCAYKAHFPEPSTLFSFDWFCRRWIECEEESSEAISHFFFCVFKYSIN